MQNIKICISISINFRHEFVNVHAHKIPEKKMSKSYLLPVLFLLRAVDESARFRDHLREFAAQLQSFDLFQRSYGFAADNEDGKL
jgi:hypothetical protein